MGSAYPRMHIHGLYVQIFKKKNKKKNDRPTDAPNFQAKRASKPFIFLSLIFHIQNLYCTWNLSPSKLVGTWFQNVSIVFIKMVKLNPLRIFTNQFTLTSYTLSNLWILYDKTDDRWSGYLANVFYFSKFIHGHLLYYNALKVAIFINLLGSIFHLIFLFCLFCFVLLCFVLLQCDWKFHTV